ncbi:hypothetical protein MtrunA17_Chr4g0030321 [Medicago truncatula]|uniref:Transmembrane protein, putative n=1 Tax=Medicago truncatula TaxID=3880 RepID=G7JSJ5_MEDTR|nr:transmembrane protein, putative [Medicago truncatula]RHN60852.1 hypothetical protein MtrunA17_Chr4g0030321 [Medicago truncatula]
MQQRSSTSNSRFSGDDHGTINIAVEQPQNAKRRRNAEDDSLDTLPVYHRTAARRDVSRSRSPPVNKMIHAIPLLVFICLFTLWWFSFPVDVKIKDGRITTIRQMDTPVSDDNARFDITILAVAASSPMPSIHEDLSGEDEMYLPPSSSPN